jgi:hypothetical protein
MTTSQMSRLLVACYCIPRGGLNLSIPSLPCSRRMTVTDTSQQQSVSAGCQCSGSSMWAYLAHGHHGELLGSGGVDTHSVVQVLHKQNRAEKLVLSRVGLVMAQDVWKESVGGGLTEKCRPLRKATASPCMISPELGAATWIPTTSSSLAVLRTTLAKQETLLRSSLTVHSRGWKLDSTQSMSCSPYLHQKK